jgi:RNase P/RNase MRP subunit POP5
MRDERQRYILFKIINGDSSFINKKAFLNALWHSIWKYFGMKEANKMGLWLTEINVAGGYGVIRCSHTTKEIVISALTMIREVSNQRIIFSPIKTSGTLKKIRKHVKKPLSK